MKKYIPALIIVMLFAASSASASPVIQAYQQAYAMNFEIYRPANLPAGWYVTFDGFPVAQVAPNQWVYGQLNYDGSIMPTNVLVGSVIPSSVPGLLRVAAVPFYSSFFHSHEYMRIRDAKINRMGWLNDEGINTIIAWHTDKYEIWVWLGNRWARLEPNRGEYLWQMLKRWQGFIIDELRKYNIYFYDEPFEAADLARQWGYIWAGKVVLRSLRHYKSGDGSEGNVTSLRDNSGGGNENVPQERENTQNRGQWDVD